MSWRGALTLILLLAALASGWSIWTYSGSSTAAASTARSDYVLKDFELVSLDVEGQESFTLRGPRLQRDPGAKSMSLTTPLFLVPDRNGAHWEVRAQHGQVPEDGKVLQLRGKVLATSPAEVLPATRIQTEQLNLFPRTNRATSAVAVTVTRPGLTMRGRGLEADFDAQQVSLLADVHSRYVPASR